MSAVLAKTDRSISRGDVSHVSLSESRRDDRHLFRYLSANTQTHGGTACGDPVAGFIMFNSGHMTVVSSRGQLIPGER
ncbi:hypothetical protein ACTXT7_007978 [Hymenolepis weldensis]